MRRPTIRKTILLVILLIVLTVQIAAAGQSIGTVSAVTTVKRTAGNAIVGYPYLVQTVTVLIPDAGQFGQTVVVPCYFWPYAVGQTVRVQWQLDAFGRVAITSLSH